MLDKNSEKGEIAFKNQKILLFKVTDYTMDDPILSAKLEVKAEKSCSKMTILNPFLFFSKETSLIKGLFAS